MIFDTNQQYDAECNDCRSYEREVKQLKSKIAALESRNEELVKALTESVKYMNVWSERRKEFESLLNHEGTNKQNEDEGV
jgi:viroplasmin and RNaseH domain-containing protein